MVIRDIVNYLEKLAPKSLQESYDNSGLLVGDDDAEVSKVLISLDVTEDVVEEAVNKSCGLIISHHPIIFGGLKSLTGKSYVERTVISAIRNNIALYAIHTNLDNIYTGVNFRIADKLGISNPRILAPRSGLLKKLIVFVPHANRDELLNAMFKAGAGAIGGYSDCSFSSSGKGTFTGGVDTDPYVGTPGERHTEPEDRIEVVVEKHTLKGVLKAMLEAHPYEEVAYDVYALENSYDKVGSGMLGMLNEPVYALDFIKKIKEIFGGVVRYTPLVKDYVQRIAWCGGSGSFLMQNAIAAQADIFITSDIKYHQFFDAEKKIIVADIGHFENEQYTIDLISDLLKEKFPTFAFLLTETNTNPINYL